MVYRWQVKHGDRSDLSLKTTVRESNSSQAWVLKISNTYRPDGKIIWEKSDWQREAVLFFF